MYDIQQYPLISCKWASDLGLQCQLRTICPILCVYTVFYSIHLLDVTSDLCLHCYLRTVCSILEVYMIFYTLQYPFFRCKVAWKLTDCVIFHYLQESKSYILSFKYFFGSFWLLRMLIVDVQMIIPLPLQNIFKISIGKFYKIWNFIFYFFFTMLNYDKYT